MILAGHAAAVNIHCDGPTPGELSLLSSLCSIPYVASVNGVCPLIILPACNLGVPPCHGFCVAPCLRKSDCSTSAKAALHCTPATRHHRSMLKLCLTNDMPDPFESTASPCSLKSTPPHLLLVPVPVAPAAARERTMPAAAAASWRVTKQTARSLTT